MSAYPPLHGRILPCRYEPGRGYYITVPHRATCWQAGIGGPRFQRRAAAEEYLLRAKGLGRRYVLGGRCPPPLPPNQLLAQGATNPRKAS